MTRTKLSATDTRNLRTLLLLNVFAPEEIGARIAQARKEAGLTQDELADILSVVTRTVQNYEAGATKPYTHLRAIADTTGRSVEWLLHGEPDELVTGAELAALRKDLAEVRAAVARIEELVQEHPPADEASP